MTSRLLFKKRLEGTRSHRGEQSFGQSKLHDDTQGYDCLYISIHYGVLDRTNGFCRRGKDHSHSMVAGGFEEMSYTTRLMPRTSLLMRLEMRPRSS
jgi:hypothetical protein